MQKEQNHITQTQENGQEKRFLHVLTASIREMRQKTFRLAIFLDFSCQSEAVLRTVYVHRPKKKNDEIRHHLIK